jgi:hypothetical protein
MVAAVGLFGRSRKALQAAEQALADTRNENQILTLELKESRAQAAEAIAARDKLSAEHDKLAAERDQLAGDIVDMRLLVESAQAAPSAPGSTEAIEGAWTLLLGNLERRWVAAVGVPPDQRGLRGATVTEQLVESLEREIERVREEVGVDVGFTIAEAPEPEQPVVYLLAALDLLGAVVFTCERVRIDLDTDLVLVGETFTELGDEIEAARKRALTAGASVDEIDLQADQVRVVLHP